MADTAQHTPMMQQYLRIKAEHPHTLVFYRMGDFYVTRAAMELQAGIHHFIDQFPGQRLDHRHFLGDALALRVAPGGVDDEQ